MIQPYQARLFIALPVPQKYRPILEQWSQLLQQKWEFKRWLHRDDYHITVKFLGECDYPKANLVKQRLQRIVQNQAPFSLSIAGLGTFDNRESSKILWAGVDGQLFELNKLHGLVDHEMEQLGFKKENNAYRPHVTLARNHLHGLLSDEEKSKAPLIKDELITWNANELVLYQTHLGQSPAYQPLTVYPFQHFSAIRFNETN